MKTEIVPGSELYTSCLSNDMTMDTEPFLDLKYFSTSEFDKETHIVVYDHDRVIGNIAIQNNPYDENSLWIMSIAVLPGYQRKGVATMMIDKLMEYASRKRKNVQVSSFSEQGQHIRFVFENLSMKYGVTCSYNN